MKYRKKQVVIDAWPVWVLLRMQDLGNKELPDLVREARARGELIFSPEGIEVTTLEGTHNIGPHGWLICGIKGEFYGCQDDVFAMTYEACP